MNLSSIPEIPTICGTRSWSKTQVDAGVIMADTQFASEIANALRFQETHGPLSRAKQCLVTDGPQLIFVPKPAEEIAAYQAVYFYVAGFLDAKA